MFVDRARIQVVAGRGGRGAISFRREKYVPKGGPDGGDGGHGGSVWFEVDPHIRTLLDCREQRRYRADNGRQGEGNNRTGRDGRDLVVLLPPGTMVRDATNGDLLADLVNPGDRFLAARGGRGGRGNARFATPTHQTPRKADPGEEGEGREIELELKLIADVGLVGAPNAGKSTMLAAMTRARPKIGAYPFTTLEPNLGIVALDEERQFVVADVPGLIEGAHQGRGLGIQFLKHVERCRALAVLVDVTVESPRDQLAEVKRELDAYHPALGEKPHVVVLTKSDLLAPERRPSAGVEAHLPDALVVSAHSGEGMRELRERLWQLVEEDLPSRSES